MSDENTFCPNCGSSIKKDAVFCKNCGRSVKNYKKNIIQRLNERINLLSILLGFLAMGIFAFLGSLFFGVFLSSGIINFITYMGLVIITMTFFGGLTIGLTGCFDYNDAKSNSIAFLLIIIDIIALIFGISFATTMGIVGTLISAFGGSTSNYDSTSLSSNSLYSSSNLDSQTTSSDPSAGILLIVQFLIFAILTVVAGVGGCYLGVFLKKFVSE